MEKGLKLIRSCELQDNIFTRTLDKQFIEDFVNNYFSLHKDEGRRNIEDRFHVNHGCGDWVRAMELTCNTPERLEFKKAYKELDWYESDEIGGVIQDLAVKHGFVSEHVEYTEIHKEFYKGYEIIVGNDGYDILTSYIYSKNDFLKQSVYAQSICVEEVIKDSKWEIDNLIKNPNDFKQEIACEENFVDLSKEDLKKIDKGIVDALAGKVKSRGSFSKYVEGENI